MPILPLPQFEADLLADEADQKTYADLSPPKTMVVRYGAMFQVGEFPYDGDAKPGCGSKIVIKTHRGTEIGEMLTTTCPNSGCGKSVSRKQMLQYIDHSGGRDYPFSTDGRVLRVATLEDMDTQAKIEQSRHELRLKARRLAESLKMPLKIVDVEALLGNERLIVYYTSEERLDLSHLLKLLSDELHERIDLRHVGSRDEARLTADYEKCGQYCCCKNFLKVLKPVSMKSAKVQKATLDPMKISGRCGRLMCCLRYEDESYAELAKRLPRRKSRVGTPEGDGLVLDSQILTQLVLVELDEIGTDGKIRQVAIPVEDLTPPVSTTRPVREFPTPHSRPPRSPSDPSRRPPRSGSGAGPRPDARSGSEPGSGPTARPERSPKPDRATRPPSPASQPIHDNTDDNRDDNLDDIMAALDEQDAGGPDRARPPRDTGASSNRDTGPRDPGERELGSGSGPRKRRRRRRRGGGGGQAGGGGSGGGGA